MKKFWKHVKTGKKYVVEEVVHFQCSTNRDFDGDALVIYRPLAPTVYEDKKSARLYVEFLEKFEQVVEETK